MSRARSVEPRRDDVRPSRRAEGVAIGGRRPGPAPRSHRRLFPVPGMRGPQRSSGDLAPADPGRVETAEPSILGSRRAKNFIPPRAPRAISMCRFPFRPPQKKRPQLFRRPALPERRPPTCERRERPSRGARRRRRTPRSCSPRRDTSFGSSWSAPPRRVERGHRDLVSSFLPLGPDARFSSRRPARRRPSRFDLDPPPLSPRRRAPSRGSATSVAARPGSRRTSSRAATRATPPPTVSFPSSPETSRRRSRSSSRTPSSPPRVSTAPRASAATRASSTTSSPPPPSTSSSAGSPRSTPPW